MVVSFCNLDVTKVDEFGSGVNVRTLGSFAGAEEVSDSNIMTNEMPKAPSESIYIYHHIITYVNDSEMIT